jgi:hypothetical protein
VLFTFWNVSLVASLPSSSVSFPGECLDLFGQTTIVPVASHPPRRHRLESSAGGGGCVPAFARFICITRVAMVIIWRMLAALMSVVDTLPPFYSSKCFASVVVLLIRWMHCRLGGLVGALPPLLRCRSLHLWRCSIFLQV